MRQYIENKILDKISELKELLKSHRVYFEEDNPTKIRVRELHNTYCQLSKTVEELRFINLG